MGHGLLDSYCKNLNSVQVYGGPGKIILLNVFEQAASLFYAPRTTSNSIDRVCVVALLRVRGGLSNSASFVLR
jgi:hypothetical protein